MGVKTIAGIMEGRNHVKKEEYWTNRGRGRNEFQSSDRRGKVTHYARPLHVVNSMAFGLLQIGHKKGGQRKIHR